jgi:hypothetical protein
VESAVTLVSLRILGRGVIIDSDIEISGPAPRSTTAPCALIKEPEKSVLRERGFYYAPPPAMPFTLLAQSVAARREIAGPAKKARATGPGLY